MHVTSDRDIEPGNLFQYNTIDSTGYIGIDFRTGHTSINNNLISNFCLIKDDGAGIYTWHNTWGNNIIKGNIIHSGRGSGEGTVNATQLFASGIYIDDLSSRVLIEDNTLLRCATAGIFLHNAKAIRLVRNTLFDNGNNLSGKEGGQLYIRTDALGLWGGTIAPGLEVFDNKWITLSETSFCIFLSADKMHDLDHLGTFDQNQFSANHAAQTIALLYSQNDLCVAPVALSLTNWQNVYHHDGHSFFTKHSEEGYETIGKNLINNGSMTITTDGWNAWPDHSTLVQDRKKIVYGPSLQVNVPPENHEVLLYQSGFTLIRNKLYRLVFSAMSAKPNKLEFVPLMGHSPWEALDDYTCFASDSTYNLFRYYFSPDKSEHAARVNFKSNTTFWIDNVSLFEIAETRKQETIKLYFNASQKNEIIDLPAEFIDPEHPYSTTLQLLPYQSKIVIARKASP